MRTPVEIVPTAKGEYPTRSNRPEGIEWHGYLFEACPHVPQVKYERRICVVEDKGDAIVIQAYARGSLYTTKLVGPRYECKLIGLGRPTDRRIDKLKERCQLMCEFCDSHNHNHPLAKEEDPMDDKFWLVWQPSGGVPRVKHATEEEALAEAQRLAEQNTNQTFYVLKSAYKVGRVFPPIAVTPIEA